MSDEGFKYQYILKQSSGRLLLMDFIYRSQEIFLRLLNISNRLFLSWMYLCLNYQVGQILKCSMNPWQYFRTSRELLRVCLIIQQSTCRFVWGELIFIVWEFLILFIQYHSPQRKACVLNDFRIFFCFLSRFQISSLSFWRVWVARRDQKIWFRIISLWRIESRGRLGLRRFIDTLLSLQHSCNNQGIRDSATGSTKMYWESLPSARFMLSESRRLELFVELLKSISDWMEWIDRLEGWLKLSGSFSI